jgi:hypothetical protein
MKRYVRNTVLTVIAAAALWGCGSSLTGTYSDANGAFTLVLKSGGTATFTFAGMPANCTYTSSGNMLNLNCEGGQGPLVMTVQSDGTLVGPPGTFMPPLKKK